MKIRITNRNNPDQKYKTIRTASKKLKIIKRFLVVSVVLNAGLIALILKNNNYI